MNSVSRRLRNERTKLGWSQERLGESIGVSKQQVAKWEDADDNLKVVVVKKLCEAMGVDLESVLIGSCGQSEDKNQVAEKSADDYNSDIQKIQNLEEENAMWKELAEERKDRISELKAEIARLTNALEEKSPSQGRQKNAS